MNIETLIHLTDYYAWEAFEQEVAGEKSILGVKVYTRIGLHLGRPMQALISQGQFIRLRKADYHQENFDLKVLDPKDPSTCLYGGWDKTWKPAFKGYGYGGGGGGGSVSSSNSGGGGAGGAGSVGSQMP